jgi:hypothetical protein
VQGATSARRSRGIAASRDSTTTGRRPISASSHHHTSPRPGSALTRRQPRAAKTPGRPIRRAHQRGAGHRRYRSRHIRRSRHRPTRIRYRYLLSPISQRDSSDCSRNRSTIPVLGKAINRPASPLAPLDIMRYRCPIPAQPYSYGIRDEDEKSGVTIGTEPRRSSWLGWPSSSHSRSCGRPADYQRWGQEAFVGSQPIQQARRRRAAALDRPGGAAQTRRAGVG